MYIFNKRFNGTAFEYDIRLENSSDMRYFMTYGARRRTAYTPGYYSSSYYNKLVYLNGVEYEGNISFSSYSHYPNYFEANSHTYLKCTIESYGHFNIKSLETIEYTIYIEPDKAPDIGENNKIKSIIKFNI